MKLLPFLLFIAFAVVGCRKASEPETDALTIIRAQADSIVAQLQEPVIPDRQIDLIEFSGHSPDESGSWDFRADIQRAIDSLSAAGGGVLYFPHVEKPDAWIKQLITYRIRGPIVLKSNIELRLAANIRLYFEFSPADYLPGGKGVLRRYEGTTLYSFSPLIYALNAQNVAVTFAGGEGALPVIDGDGWKWQKWSYQGDLRAGARGLTPAYKEIRTTINDADMPLKDRICIDTAYHFFRPTMMEFFHCERVKVEGVKLVNSPFWLIHPVFSKYITVRNVMFDAQVVNNDGVDIESSQYALIENVVFDNHDDNVVIKAGANREGREGILVAGTEIEHIGAPWVKNGRLTAPSEDVVVRNCVFKGHYAFCIGSEIAGGARNIYVFDCIAPMDVKMGVFLKSSRKRGGVVENIYVDNFRLNEVGSDVICMIPNYDGDTVSAHPTVFRNIHISRVYARSSGFGLRVAGWQDAPIENVQFSDIQIDTVLSPVAEEVFLMLQVRNIVLNDVNINIKPFDGEYNRLEKGVNPPRQK